MGLLSLKKLSHDRRGLLNEFACHWPNGGADLSESSAIWIQGSTGFRLRVAGYEV